MKCFLIVEDDENLSRGIAFAFERDGYQILSANTIAKAKSLLKLHKADLMILDLSLIHIFTSSVKSPLTRIPS